MPQDILYFNDGNGNVRQVPANKVDTFKKHFPKAWQAEESQLSSIESQKATKSEQEGKTKITAPQVNTVDMSAMGGGVSLTEGKPLSERASDIYNIHKADPEISFRAKYGAYKEDPSLFRDTENDPSSTPLTSIASEFHKKNKKPGEMESIQDFLTNTDQGRAFVDLDSKRNKYFADLDIQLNKEIENLESSIREKATARQKLIERPVPGTRYGVNPQWLSADERARIDAAKALDVEEADKIATQDDLNIAARNLEELKMLRGAVKDRDTNAVAQFFNEAGRRLPKSLYNIGTMGFGDVIEGLSPTKGGKLSAQSENLLNQYAALHQDDRSIAQDIAQGAVGSLEFMAQFAGAGGVVGGIGKNILKQGVKQAATKGPGRMLRIAGKEVSETLMQTAIMPSTIAMAIENNAQNPGSFLDSFANAYLSNLVEVGSERVGQFIPGPKFKLPSSVQKLQKATGIDGMVGEFLEEQIATAGHSALGDGQAEWSDLIDPRQQLITAGVVGIIQLPYASINAAGYAAGKFRNVNQKRSINKAFTQNMEAMNAVFGTDTEPTIMWLNNAIDQAQQSGEGIASLMASLVNKGEFAEEQTNAMLNYGLSYLAKKGLETAKEEQIQNAQAEAQQLAEQAVNPETNSIILATVPGMEEPTRIQGDVILREDGSIDASKSGEIYYTDAEGKRKVIDPRFIEIVENVPAEQAIEELSAMKAADVVNQHANDEVRPYEAGELVRFTADGNVSMLGQIQGADEAGNYQVIVDGTPTPVIVEPRMIINEDNLQGVDNGVVVDYADEKGNVLTGTVDDMSIRGHGVIVIDGNEIRVENVIGVHSEEETQAPSTIITSEKTPENEGSTIGQTPQNVTETAETEAESQNAAEVQAVQEFPKDKDGNIDYSKITDNNAYVEALRSEFGDEAYNVVDDYRKAAEKALKSVDKINDPIRKRREQARRQAELDRWNSMIEATRPKAKAPTYEEEYNPILTKNTRERESQMGDYLSLRDYLLRNIGTGKLRFMWNSRDGIKGLKDEILSSKNTQMERLRRIAFLDNNGFTPETLAEFISDNNGQDIPEFSTLDVQDIRNEINDVLLSFDTPTDMIEAAEKLRRDDVSLESYIEQNISPDDIANYEANEASQDELLLTLPEQEAPDISEQELNEYYGTEGRIESTERTADTESGIHGRAEQGGQIPLQAASTGIEKTEERATGEQGTRDSLAEPDQERAEHAIAGYDNQEDRATGAERKYSAGQIISINGADHVISEAGTYVGTNDHFYTIEKDGQTVYEDITQDELDKLVSEKTTTEQPSVPSYNGDIVDYARNVVKNEEVKQEAAKVDTNPTDAQKESGNYKKGHVNVQGFDITIENPKGSVRSGVDASGKKWSVEMKNHYGYFKRTEGYDGDQIDTFIGPNPENSAIFVVDQVNNNKSFDESKVMLGFNSIDEAREAYLSNYEAGWQGLGAITETTVDDFKKWLYDGAKQRKAFSEYKENKPEYGANNKIITTDRYNELREQMRKKLNNLNVGFDPEVFSIGAQMAMYHIESGANKFAEFAKRMVDDLGDAIRPYLKASYEGARAMPGMEELSKTMDPYNDVVAFDVNKNFNVQSEYKERKEQISREIDDLIKIRDQKYPNPDIESPMSPEEKELNSRISKLQSDRNQLVLNNRKQNGQKERSTETIEAETETIETASGTIRSESENVGNNKQRAGQVKEKAADQIRKVERLLNEIDQKLASLKLSDKEYSTEGIAADYPINVLAKGPIRKDVTAYVKAVAAMTGLDHDTNSKGKTEVVNINIAPAGGNASFILWSKANPEYGVYVSIPYDPDVNSGGYYDNYKVRDNHILWRVTTKQNKWRGLYNQWLKVDATAQEMAETILKGLDQHLRSIGLQEEVKPVINNMPDAEKNKKVKKKTSKSDIPSLFDIFDENNYDNVSDIQNNSLTLDEGNEEVKPVNSNQNDEPRRRNEETDSSLGTGTRQEVGRTEQGGMDRSGIADNGPDRSGSGRIPGSPDHAEKLQLRNTNNNRNERGKDYSPKSPKARFNANITAIKLMRKLNDSGITVPTKEQMETLRMYSGWGGLGTFFDNDTTENQTLRTLLSDEEYQNASDSVRSAYYTPADVIDSLWDIAERLGFKGGKVLESSAGIGSIIGSMPQNISDRSTIEGVEIDSVSGEILKLLYPDAKIHVQGFENTNIRNGSVDLAITNVPFVTGLNVYDPVDKDLSRKFKNIHDFVIAKNIRKLKEGGIGIFITTKGTLDSSKKLREWIVSNGSADVIGAFRLNNETFEGTGVTSDIIVVRKRVAGKVHDGAINVIETTIERSSEYETDDAKWVRNKGYVREVKEVDLIYNKYFADNPQFMGGEMAFGFEHGDTYRPASISLYPKKGINQNERLYEWVKQFDPLKDEVPVDDKQKVRELEETSIKEGQLFIDSKGNIAISSRGLAEDPGINSNKVKGRPKTEVLKDYNSIKESVDALLKYQIDSPDDSGLKPHLDKLNKAYDDFVSKYGQLNNNTSISWLRKDVDFPAIAALEKYKEHKSIDGKKTINVNKTLVFKQRVIGYKSKPVPKNIKDAVVASVYEYNDINIPYISEALSISEDNVREQILSEGLGFSNPQTGAIEIRHRYLSGNVREKLRIAKDSNVNGEYDANIMELEKVVPMDIPAHLIDMTIGSTWVPPSIFEQYFMDRYGVRLKLHQTEGAWVITPGSKGGQYNDKNRQLGVYSEMFQETIFGDELAYAAMNNRNVVFKKIRKNYDGSQETITDKEASATATRRISEIKADFTDWSQELLTSNEEIAEKIMKTYNDKFNAIVPMSIDEKFIPEKFDGAATFINLYPHQLKSAVRATMQPLFLAHEVGTGKTFTIISAAMEMRRVGTAKKPMIVVQNATIGQFVAEAKTLYPNAKILALSDSDRDKKGRLAFYANIKYNDWDMVIIPQSTFDMIPDSPERQRTFIEEKIDEKIRVIEAMRDVDTDGRIVKQMEDQLEDLYDELAGRSSKKKKKSADRSIAVDNAGARAKEQLDRRTDDVQYFDDLGVDALLVDEAHAYKKLGYETTMARGVKGIDTSRSKRAAGLYIKSRAILEKSGWKNFVLATGTPITNTAAELWTFMRFLLPKDTLIENDMYYFDDFAKNFGSIDQMLEFATSGKYKENTRFAKYINLAELVRIWASVSDTVLTKEAGYINDKVPVMETGQAQDVYLEQSDTLVDVMRAVRKKLEEFDKMSGKEKKQFSYIPIVMYGIAKRAAIDTRLIDKNSPDEPLSKTNKTVDEVLKSLKDTKSYNGTVAVFCDNQNRKDDGVVTFNIFEDIKQKLIDKGVPENQIIIMKSGMNIKQKQKIFADVNEGVARVIMGSTETLGTGVNIQERLHTLIHMDAPDLPMQYTQRMGRILRQGNLHKEWNKPVRVLRFGVVDSLDVTAYQRLQTKSNIIDSVMDGKTIMANAMENRSIEESSESGFGNTVAQLSGSQYALLKNHAEKELQKLLSKRKQHEYDQIYISNQVRRNEGIIRANESIIKDAKDRLSKIKSFFPEGKPKSLSIAGNKIEGKISIEEALKEYVNKPVNEFVENARKNTSYKTSILPFEVKADNVVFTVNVKITRDSAYDEKAKGLRISMRRNISYSSEQLNMEEIPVSGAYAREAINDILENVIPGKDDSERIEYVERSSNRLRAENVSMNARKGKKFELEDDLREAEKKVEEYAVLMQKELEEKEKKYNERGSGKDVDIESIELEDEEIESDETDTGYREDKVKLRLDDESDLEETLPEKITVDGIERSTINSDGKRIAPTREGIINFWRWFGNSKVVDKQGRPIVVYHGTKNIFDAFDESTNKYTGFYFTNDPELADSFAGGNDADPYNGTGNIMPVYLRLENPVIEDFENDSWDGMEKVIKKVKASNHDGYIGKNVYDVEFIANQYVAFSPEQIKSAIGNTGSFDPANNDIRFRMVDESGFYSTVEDALENIRQEKGTPEQFKAMLLKNGAKQAELDWMGWDDFASDINVVSKSDIQDWINQNRIEIKEAQKGNRIKEINEEFEKKKDDWVYNVAYDAYKNGADRNKALFHAENIRNAVSSRDKDQINETADDWNYLSKYNNPDEIDLNEIHDIEEDHMYQQDSFAEETKFSQYTLPGGKNYKELLLTMPIRVKAIDEVTELPSGYEYIKDGTKWGVIPVEQVHARPFSGLHDTKEAAMKSAIEKINRMSVQKAEENAYKDTFKSSHFEESNILAHVRFNEREVNGERVLFLEEIQSDWAQKGKKEGFKRDNVIQAEKSYEEAKAKLDEINNELEDVIKQAQDIGLPVGASSSEWRSFTLGNFKNEEVYRIEYKLESVRNSREWDEYKSMLDEIADKQRKIGEKRLLLIKEANEQEEIVEERKENIDREKSWGELHGVPDMPFKKTDQWVNLALRRMMRYAAENGFDRIAWTTGEQQANRYDLSNQIDEIEVSNAGKDEGYRIYFKKGDYVHNSKIVTESELPDFVGKDLAGKIVADNIPEFKSKTYSGLDLKVGGEGMKAFYDNIVPKAAKKLGKPFGAEVEAIEIPKIGTQQSIPVTDLMKKTALQGMPMFRKSEGKEKPTFKGDIAKFASEMAEWSKDISDSDYNDGLQRIIELAKAYDEAYSPQLKLWAAYDLVDEIDQVFSGGEFKTVALSSRSAMINSMRSHGLSEDQANKLEKSKAKVMGAYYASKVFINIAENKTGADIIGTWIHENAHDFNKNNWDKVVSLESKIDESVIDNYLPGSYKNDDKADKIDELVSFVADEVMFGNDVYDFGDAQNDVIDLVEQYLNKITYGRISKSRIDRWRRGSANENTLADNQGSGAKSYRTDAVRTKTDKQAETLRPGTSGSGGISSKGVRLKSISDVADSVNSKMSEILRKEYDVKYNQFFTRFREAWEDTHLPVKNFLDLLRKNNVEVAEYNDFYKQATHLQGKNDAQLKIFKDTYQHPITLAINAIEQKGFSYRDIENYVFSKHGIERNEYMLKQEAKEEVDKMAINVRNKRMQSNSYLKAIESNDQDKINEAKKEVDKFVDDFIYGLSQKEANIWLARRKMDLNTMISNGTIDSDKYDELLDKANNKQKKLIKGMLSIREDELEGKDYAGITALEEELGETAQAYIDKFEDEAGNKIISDLWTAINKATKWTLTKQYQTGMMNKDTYDELTSRYKYYVPLRGHDKETAEDRWDYTPDMGTYFTAPLLKATGRRSRAESPFAYIAQMAHSAITQGNKNTLKQAILRLAQKENGNLMSATRTWKVNVGTEENPIWERQSAPYSEDLETYLNNQRAFEERMQELKNEGMAFQGRTKLNIGDLFIKPKQAEQHEIQVFQNGISHTVYINANPAIARAINGANRKDIAQNLGFLANVTRNMAANFTTRNPLFIMTNLSRDYIFASTMILAKETPKYEAMFQGNLIKSLSALQRYERGKVDLNNQSDKYLYEYLVNGGKTGFSHIFELNRVAKSLEREAKKGGEKNWKDHSRAIIDVIDTFNEVAENMTRLSVYITSRQNGRSIATSVNDAKNITVNFNQKGAGSSVAKNSFERFILDMAGWVRPLYLFTNAAIQALSNVVKVTAKHPAKMASIVASYSLLGFISPLLAQLLGGDDGEEAYLKLTDWERQNNWCILLPNGSFLKIPLPHELRVFHRLGDNIYQSVVGKQDILQTLLDTMFSISDLLPINPMGAANSSWADLLPDVIRPFAQMVTNKNFMGSRIYNEWANENMPGYLKARTNKKGEYYAPNFMVDWFRYIDHITGGDSVKKGVISLNPDIVNHLLRGYFGGLYTLSEQGVGIASEAYNFTQSGEFNMKIRETPLKTFYADKNDLRIESSGLSSKYYEVSEKVNEARRRNKGYFEKVQEGDMSIEDYSRRVQDMNMENVNFLYDKIREIKRIEQDLKEMDPEQQKEAEQMIFNLKKEVVDMNNLH